MKYKVLREYTVNTYPNVRTVKAPDPIRKGEIVEGTIISKIFSVEGGAIGSALIRGMEVDRGVGSAFIREDDLEPVSGNSINIWETKEAKTRAALGALGSVIFLLYAISKKKKFWACVGFWILGGIVGSSVGYFVSGKED